MLTKINGITKTSNHEDDILRYINFPDYIKGRRYYQLYIDLISKKQIAEIKKYYFRVESERRIAYYNCHLEVDTKGEIRYLECDCPQFEGYHSCKHLAACLYHYQDEIFDIDLDEKQIENITRSIFDYFKEQKFPKLPKKELTIKIGIETSDNYYYTDDNANIYIEIGLDRLYKCSSSKLNNFLNAYENKEQLYFGKQFTYNPNIQYINDQDKEIINYIQSIKEINRYNNQSLILRRNSLKALLKKLKDRDFVLNGYRIINYLNGYPLSTFLDKEEDKYKLAFNNIDNLKIITNDFEYIQIEQTLYHLNQRERDLLEIVLSNDLNNLIFTKEDVSLFSKTILPTIKKNIEIDQKINDIIIVNDPIPKLYFDLYKDKIVCNLKFDYNDIEVDYFEDNNNILRNEDFEMSILEDLYSYHFEILNKKIIIENLDDIAFFLEEGILEITNKYKIYTSEKLNDVNIIRKSNVSSTFSIGKDNIMSYNFDLGDIKQEEIVNIFSSLKNKKKYFRLKNGNIIDLEKDNELKQLHELATDMDIDEKSLTSGGVIPKYRAIYLDSLRNSKYSIIKTNNLFKELINKFNAYKDANINLSKSDTKILRDYQLNGVKWLYNIHQTGFGGILADEMGLGKSVQVIYFIKELLKENKNYKFLIVSPTSLAYNWKQEFEKFESNMKYKVLVGLKQKRLDIQKNIENINILITTYGLLREDKEFYKSIDFKVMIIDEAQNIKNNNTEITKTVKNINAETKFALTGTPIENSIVELWSIFDYIMPGFLGNVDKFEKKYKINDFDDDTNERLSKLNNLISPFILRRRKKEVIKELPEKIENNIFIELTKEQKKIYLAELEKVNKQMEEILSNEGIKKARFLILQLLTKLRQICIDPRILYTNYDGGSGKMIEFVNTVKGIIENNHKILIFTSFKTALLIAREELTKNGITSYKIDGTVSSKKRIELVNKFNNDNTNVFFIMLKSGGTGLNLTSADIVIHLDLWWNPQAENQATDRAHRIGQKNVVEVIKFICKGTIEEKILDLQNKKKLLSDKLIDSSNEENSFSKLTEKDIKYLLSYENGDN